MVAWHGMAWHGVASHDTLFGRCGVVDPQPSVGREGELGGGHYGSFWP